MNIKHTAFVALCPNCENPFHFTECKFAGGENDRGGWKVQCQKCSKPFRVNLINPRESFTAAEWQILERFNDLSADEDLPVATDVVMHNLPLSKVDLNFSLNSSPLYVCKKCSSPLDGVAYSSLSTVKDSLQSAWQSAENYLLAASGPSSDQIFVSLKIKCACLDESSAIFSAKTSHGASSVPMADRCLLVHVENTDFEDRLNCLASKSEIMDLLEKLLIRWHAICNHIFLATPFIGHQWMKEGEVQEIWDWLFKNLDPSKVTLITRKATFTSFKKIQQVPGLKFDDLERYGLEDKVVSAGSTKQDFHAKFFVGVSRDMVEMLSGSANLLRGPSIENISFKRMTLDKFKDHYIQVMNYRGMQPPKSRRAGDVLLFDGVVWKHTVYDSLPWWK